MSLSEEELLALGVAIHVQQQFNLLIRRAAAAERLGKHSKILREMRAYRRATYANLDAARDLLEAAGIGNGFMKKPRIVMRAFKDYKKQLEKGDA